MYRTRARMLTATAIVAALLPIGATGDAADREESRGVTCDEPVTRRVSVSDDEDESTRHSSMPSISGDGRFVAFASKAPNLVPGDDNHQFDVFVRDRLDGTTELVSASTSGEIGNGASLLPAISRNGRFVAFNSEASNFVAGDVDPTGGEGALEVFVHDRQTGVTERIAFSSDGGYVPLPSFSADISSRGRYVVFAAAAALTPKDDNITYDIYVRDREAATTELVSVPESGPHRNLPSLFSAISGNGRFVTFESSQPGLVPGDTNRWNDVFVTDRRTGEIERVSVDSSGGQARKGSERARHLARRAIRHVRLQCQGPDPPRYERDGFRRVRSRSCFRAHDAREPQHERTAISAPEQPAIHLRRRDEDRVHIGRREARRSRHERRSRRVRPRSRRAYYGAGKRRTRRPSGVRERRALHRRRHLRRRCVGRVRFEIRRAHPARHERTCRRVRVRPSSACGAPS